jgi:hypothetical protein
MFSHVPSSGEKAGGAGSSASKKRKPESGLPSSSSQPPKRSAGGGGGGGSSRHAAQGFVVDEDRAMRALQSEQDSEALFDEGAVPSSLAAEPACRARERARCVNTNHGTRPRPAVTAEWQRGEEDVDRMKAESAMLKISLLMAFDPRLEDQVRALLSVKRRRTSHHLRTHRTTHSPWLPTAAPAHVR